jgi:hypothetical protein
MEPAWDAPIWHDVPMDAMRRAQKLGIKTHTKNWIIGSDRWTSYHVFATSEMVRKLRYGQQAAA